MVIHDLGANAELRRTVGAVELEAGAHGQGESTKTIRDVDRDNLRLRAASSPNCAMTA
jgi:hypothetical protein